MVHIEWQEEYCINTGCAVTGDRSMCSVGVYTGLIGELRQR